MYRMFLCQEWMCVAAHYFFQDGGMCFLAAAGLWILWSRGRLAYFMNPAMIPMMVCQTVIFAGRALLMLSPDTRWKWTEWGVSTVQSHHDQIHAFEVQRYNSQSIIIFCRRAAAADSSSGLFLNDGYIHSIKLYMGGGGCKCTHYLLVVLFKCFLASCYLFVSTVK